MKKAVAIGTFDGLHLGHRTVLDTLKAECFKRNLLPYIYTFANIPTEFLTNEKNLRIMTADEKLNELNKLGFNDIIIKTFNSDYAKMTREQFLYELNEMQVLLCVVGSSFTFGCGGRGTPGDLKEIGKKYGIDVIILPTVKKNGKIVSSSYIRELIINGDIKTANELLTRPYAVSGEVIHGEHLGKKLGFPTANQMYTIEKLYPKNGVYAAKTDLNGKNYRCVTNVGTKPTVEGGVAGVETHIIGFDGDLYGREIKVEFLDFIRPECKFPNTELLIKSIKNDINRVKGAGRRK